MDKLLRALGLRDAFCLVVGSVVGTGIFLKTATMTQLLNSPTLVLTAWFLAGLLSLMGALSYAEIGSMFPKAGGEYVYLKNGYGDLVAFLYGWMRFWIAAPGSIAAYTVGSVTFLSAIYPLTTFERNLLAVGVILFFSLLNCLKVAVGGTVQSIITAIKILVIIFIGIGILTYTDVNHLSFFSIETSSSFSFKTFSAALVAALWAYDGWNNLPMVAGEVENPQKNIPRSLILGMGVVLVLYVGINFAYFYALDMGEIVTSTSKLHPDGLPVATNAAKTFLKESSVVVLSCVFIMSALGALNGAIMTSARVPYAMAEDGLFLRFFAKVGKRSHVPYVSILVQALVSIILSLSGTFDQLTDYVVFSSWIFYTLVVLSVFIFRRRKMESSYRTFAYPLPPLFFITLAIFILSYTVINDPIQSLIGIIFILIGIPVFYLRSKYDSKI